MADDGSTSGVGKLRYTIYLTLTIAICIHDFYPSTVIGHSYRMCMIFPFWLIRHYPLNVYHSLYTVTSYTVFIF